METTELGTLVVVVLKARNLRDNHSFWKQDVYATVTLGRTKKTTKTDVKGGQHPMWDDEVRLPVLSPDAGVKDARALEVCCWSVEHKQDEMIGKGVVDITDTLRTGEFDDWVKLEVDGAYRGEIYLEMTYFASGPAPVKRHASKLLPNDRLARPTDVYVYPGQSPPRSKASSAHTSPTHSPNRQHLGVPGAAPVLATPSSHSRNAALPSLPSSSSPSVSPASVPSLLRPGNASVAAPPAHHRRSSDPRVVPVASVSALSSHHKTPSINVIPDIGRGPAPIGGIPGALQVNPGQRVVSAPINRSHISPPQSPPLPPSVVYKPVLPGPTQRQSPPRSSLTDLPPAAPVYQPILPVPTQPAVLPHNVSTSPVPPANYQPAFPIPVPSPSPSPSQFAQQTSAYSPPNSGYPYPVAKPQAQPQYPYPGYNNYASPPLPAQPSSFYPPPATPRRPDAGYGAPAAELVPNGGGEEGLPDPYLIARYQTPLPLPPGTAPPQSPPKQQQQQPISQPHQGHMRTPSNPMPGYLPAEQLREHQQQHGAAEYDPVEMERRARAKRKEQEEADLELARRLDRELNLADDEADAAASVHGRVMSGSPPMPGEY